MVPSGRAIARMNATVDNMNDEAGSGVLYIRPNHLQPNNARTWYNEIPTPERNRNPTQTVKKRSILMESKMSEVPDTTAAPNSTIMQNIRRSSMLTFFCGGWRERREAKAALAAAITATARLSATATRSLKNMENTYPLREIAQIPSKPRDRSLRTGLLPVLLLQMLPVSFLLAWTR